MMESNTTPKQFPKRSEVVFADTGDTMMSLHGLAEASGLKFIALGTNSSDTVLEIISHGTCRGHCTVADLFDDRPEGSGTP